MISLRKIIKRYVRRICKKNELLSFREEVKSPQEPKFLTQVRHLSDSTEVEKESEKKHYNISFVGDLDTRT